jgi:hypothetical protein
MADYTAHANCKLAYLFSEGSGTSVADASGNSATGTFNSSGHPAWSVDVPSFGTSGSAAGSVSYDTAGSLEIISDGTSNSLLPYNAAQTGVCWIKPTVDVINTGDPRVFARGSVYFALAATKKVYFNVDGSTANARFSANNTITFGSWQHIAYTWDGTNFGANVHIYLNGVEVSYASATNGSSTTTNSGATTYIGNRSDGTRAVGGLMTEVAIFNSVLDVTDIQAIYNYGLRPAGSSSIKTVNGLTITSVKTINDLAIASVKTANGLA